MRGDIIGLIILLFFSGFFSGIEIAFFSISNIKVRHLVDKKVRGAKKLQRLKSDPHKLLITILVGNNVVNIGATALATVIAIDFFGSKGAGIATGAMTLLVLIFGEITPKAIATQHAQKVSLLVSTPILWLQWVLSPVTFVLDKSVKIITRIIGSEIKDQGTIVTEDELKSIVNVSHEVGEITDSEKDMIHNIFEFDDVDVKEVMVPRTDMICIDVRAPMRDVLKIFNDHKFSRIPIFDGRIDNILGVIYIKSLLDNITRINSVSIKDVMEPAFFVPETKKIDSLLREFQRKKKHLAIVVSEHGGVEGLITTEDILEEIVGEIYDEHEQPEDVIEEKEKNVFIVKGNAEIDEVNETLIINLPYGEGYDTIGGFLLEKFGRIPKKNEKLIFEKIVFIIEKVEDNRISSVKILKKR